MKKVLSLLLILAICLACTPAFSMETMRKKFESGNFKYALLEDGTAEITHYSGEAKALRIPSELDGHSVTVIGKRRFTTAIA